MFLVYEINTDIWRVSFSWFWDLLPLPEHWCGGSLLKPLAVLSKTTEVVSYQAQVWVGASWSGLRFNHQGFMGTHELEIYCFVINVLSLPREVLPLLLLVSYSSSFHGLNQSL